MAFRFLPKEEKFFEFFEAHAALNVEAAKIFRDLAHDWKLESPAFHRLQELEHEADITAHEIYDKLNRTFVTPFDREDIHALAGELDDIVDLIEATASRMRLFRIPSCRSDLLPLSDILWDAVENVRKAVCELKHPEKTRRALDYCIEINRLENAGDRALENALGQLFEGRPDPLEVIKWKEIYETTEIAIDKCEDVAHTIESILVKQA